MKILTRISLCLVILAVSILPACTQPDSEPESNTPVPAAKGMSYANATEILYLGSMN